MMSLLHNPAPLRITELYMDIMPGIDEPGFGGLQPDLNREPAG
jgi:hypothetical protein